MRDIVATIQADQYRLITSEPDGVLVIQGGPGTGKTAVGLHRASWLLYTYRRELERSGVLVVGPNPVFMDYISHVLPMLGEERVEQRAVNELVDGIEAARSDPAEVARLKGDPRLANVIAAAVRALPRPPDELLAIRLEGVELRLSAEEVGGLIEDAQAESADHAAGRERLRMKLVRAFYERYTARLGNAAYHSFDDIEATLRSGGFLNRTLGALWPRPKAEQLVRRLLDEPRAARSRRGRHPRRGRATPPPVGPRPGLERSGPVAPGRGARAPRRARPRPRPPDRRRGPGPDADATAHARTALVGSRHDARRHRPVVGADLVQRLGRGRPVSGTRGVAGGRGAAPRLPRPGRGDGAGAAAAPVDRPRRRSADRVPRAETSRPVSSVPSPTASSPSRCARQGGRRSATGERL